MNALLKLSTAIDALNERIGKMVVWLVLASVLISAINATVRKTFHVSSNAYLEIQWYLYAAVFLLASGYTLLSNEHVRIDVIVSRFSARTRAWIEIVGTVFFLLPLVVLVTSLSIPYFWNAFVSGEVSSNSGGLIRWPVYLLIPCGFTLLGLQGLSELIKRCAFLQGLIPDPSGKKAEKTVEEELADFVRDHSDGAPK